MARIQTAPLVVHEGEIARAFRRLRGLMPPKGSGDERCARLAVAKRVQLEHGQGVCYAEARNGHAYGRVYLRAQVSDSRFEAHVSLDALRQGVRGMKTCRMAHTPDGLQIRGDKAAVELPAAAAMWLPLPDQRSKPVLRADAVEFADLVNRVRWFVHRGGSHPAWRCVTLLGKRAYATDNYRLVTAALPGEQFVWPRITVLGRDLALTVALARQGALVLERTSEWLILRRTGEEWRLRLFAGPVPEYERVLSGAPGEPDFDGDLDAGAMYDACATVAEGVPNVLTPKGRVEIEFGCDGVVVRSATAEARVPVRTSRAGSVTVGALAHFARDTFGAMPNGLVRVTAGKDERPITVSAETMRAVLMPCRKGNS